MISSSNVNEAMIMQQNILYYDKIASQYDHILDQDKENAVTRNTVAGLFLRKVPGGTVLDFGAGTGKDLAWLSKNNYQVIVCEPSTAMREIAMRFNKEKLQDRDILFLDEAKTDFRGWQETLPFESKADAVLCNFAVINCIPALSILFKSLAMVTRPGAQLFALVLNSSFKKRWRSNRRGTIASLFSGATVQITVEFGHRQQTVYLHTLEKIIKASGSHFDLHHITALKENEFSLIHLIRK